MNLVKKRFSFFPILIAFLFFFNPWWNLIDFLPDSFGCLILFFSLDGFSDLNERISLSRKQFLILFFGNLLREVLLFFLSGTQASRFSENLLELPTVTLLTIFLWAIFQIFLFPSAIKNLFSGLSELAEKCGGDSLLVANRSGTLLERMEKTLVRLSSLFALWTLLPELFALRQQTGQSAFFGAYGYIGMLRILVMLPISVGTLIFWLSSVRFFRIAQSDSAFRERILSAYRSECLGRPGFLQNKKSEIARFFFSVGLVFTLTLRVAYHDLFPAFLFAVSIFVGTLFLQKKNSGCLITSFLLFVLGLVRIWLNLRYLTEYVPSDAAAGVRAYEAFLPLRIVDTSEALLSVLLSVLLFRMLKRWVREQISVIYPHGEDAQARSQEATERLRRSLISELLVGFVFLWISQTVSVADALFRAEIAWIWIPALLLGICGISKLFSAFQKIFAARDDENSR